MEVTEVKVKLVETNRDRLKAYCTMTLDGQFVVRDLKLIEGSNGLFVAMPSRKLADRCPSCSGKNHLRAHHCNNCGGRLDENRGGTDRDGRPKLHADIAHPINSGCRERIQKAIEAAYHDEVERSKQPGYRPVNLDEPEDVDYTSYSGAGASDPVQGESPGGNADSAGNADEDGDKPAFGDGIL